MPAATALDAAQDAARRRGSDLGELSHAVHTKANLVGRRIVQVAETLTEPERVQAGRDWRAPS
ncbi:hypothetical protein MSM1_11765 [Mycobacterium sp. SM1]|uniref:hypothetical protein n=1 Tax=Mycobacterium sp. SM1 TaxID=2816243 RepID=UPI001BCC91A8|nr:hypothetical protein [Mycobacterium sp. SM1]MBS4728978.1 hypothetical protein [Mycobacterium sp. SM1]